MNISLSFTRQEWHHRPGDLLGLDAVGMTLLLLTLGLSTLTFASARTNVMLGAVHLLWFLAYLMLIFEK